MNRKLTFANILVAKAKRYRNLTRMIGDDEASQRILELTEELKQQALALATPGRITFTLWKTSELPLSDG